MKKTDGARPGISGEIGDEIQDADTSRRGKHDGPLIPAEKPANRKQAAENLLETIEHDSLQGYEEMAAGAGDAEWTRFADRKGSKPAKSRIDLDELPASATGLKETLAELHQAEAFNLRGEDNISRNLHRQAIEDFSRALAINPRYVDALLNRAGAYAQLGRFNDALKDYNSALEFEKRDAEIYNKRGEIYLQNDMFDQAIKDFTAAIVLNPMHSDAYLNRGKAYSSKDMPEEAMNDFNQAIHADSGQSFSFIDRAAPIINIYDENSGSREEAGELNRQGLAALQGGNYKAAAESFTRAISISEGEAESYINRGQAYLELGQPDEALADFNQAVLYDPLNAPLYYWRAQAWKAKDSPFNMTEDLKLSCQLGYAPACTEYREGRSSKN